MKNIYGPSRWLRAFDVLARVSQLAHAPDDMPGNVMTNRTEKARFMSDDTNDPDSEPTGAHFDPEATARLLGLTDKQLAWCKAVLKGANQTAACREAGYEGTDQQLRSQGSSRKVIRFLELAALDGGNSIDQPMDMAERRRILARMARGTDRATSLRAIEVLHRIDNDERAANVDDSPDPVEALKRLAEEEPDIACFLARRDGFEIPMTAEMRARADQQCEEVAFRWIHDHPLRAAELARGLAGYAAPC